MTENWRPADPRMRADPPRTMRGFVAAIHNGILSGFPPCCVLEYAVWHLLSAEPCGAAMSRRAGHSERCWPTNYDRVPCWLHSRWIRRPVWFCQCGTEVHS